MAATAISPIPSASQATSSADHALNFATRVSSAKQLGLLIQWNFRRSVEFLPLVVVIQIAMAVLTLLGYGLLMGDVPVAAANYLVTGATDRKSTRLNSSHSTRSRMPSSA
jgi:ABC-2 type transport system permease protein